MARELPLLLKRQDQEGGVVRGQTVKTPERVAEAQRLRAEGKTTREIAEQLAVARSTVNAWLTDPDDLARRSRYEARRGACVDCGAPTAGDITGGRERCHSCNATRWGDLAAAREQARVEDRRRRIVELWADGLTTREIAAQLGVTRDNLNVTIHKMRRQGYDLPYRRSAADIAAIRRGVETAA